MTRSSALALALVGATGCGEKEGEDTAASVDPAPQPGHWSTTEETITQDSCAIADADADDDLSDDGFHLEIDGAVMVLTYDDVEEGMPPATTCALDGWLFACEPQSFQQDYRSQDIDAVLTFTQDISGTFSSAVSLQADLALEMTCAGEDCPTLEAEAGWSFPCLYAVRIAAQADEGSDAGSDEGS